jgi:hypothetical protein|tara:strand:- start:1520 stop:2206 length:687 start_codon:yes stop_codon:yes gene_type:complete
MINKNITFCAMNKEMVDIWPHPEPAIKSIPKDYKQLERFEKGNLHKGTVKTCMPFLDAMTAGYIIYFEQDYIIDPTETDFTITPANKMEDDTGYHYSYQLTDSYKKTAGDKAGKFINKWLIRTPPGYSCLFVQPMNRIENRFQIISGVVDTDNYINGINFPFVLLKRDEQFILKKGEPMIQVIPFKRESWKKWSGFYIEKDHKKTYNVLMSSIIDKYKKYFWKKKSYK